jgi:ankyrin repeat protein
MGVRTGVKGVVLALAWGVAGSAQGQEASSGPRLLTAIRAGDSRLVESLLRSGTDANTRDQAGATALMHATAFGTVETMRLLLGKGADVKASDKSGATALLWGTFDEVRVRLLLERGADVNASRSDSMTPFLSASLRGTVGVMRTLAAAGADRRKGSVLFPWPTSLARVALSTNDARLLDFVDRSELTPAATAKWAPPLLTSWLLTSTFSWRPQPARSNVEMLKVLLDAGANPSEAVEQLVLSAPALSRVARLGDVGALRLLLARGADPNATGTGGMTPLMMAAATTAAPEMVNLLLAKRASATVRDKNGHTALDWALRLGETEAARVLRAAGAVAYAPPILAPAPAATPRSAVAAMEAAVARLQPAGPGFQKGIGCISCHNQSLPAIAVKLADARGVRINRALASHPTEATLKVWSSAREQMIHGQCSVFGFLANVTYGLFGLAEEGVAPSPVTDAVVSCLAGLQKPDGSWEGLDVRPPLSARLPLVFTALAVRGLQVYGVPGRDDDNSARIARGLAFLRTAAPADTQEEVFRLLGLIWAGGSRSEIVDQRRRVLNLQRRDGGWGQMPTMASDAYSTGQALYALGKSGMAASSATFRNGTRYLLGTQLADGTWYVRSRAIGFQPYIDSGFPHGPDQFISAAATSWAVMALSFAS